LTNAFHSHQRKFFDIKIYTAGVLFCCTFGYIIFLVSRYNVHILPQSTNGTRVKNFLYQQLATVGHMQ